MTNHCLNKQELQQFLEKVVDEKPITDPELDARVSLATIWQEQLGVLSYMVSHLLLRRKKSGEDALKLLDALYALDTTMWITIQEMDSEFVSFMLRNLSDSSIDLEEQLGTLQSRLMSFDYDSSLRY